MGSLMPYWWLSQMESNTKLNMCLPHQSVVTVTSIYWGNKHSPKNLCAAVALGNGNPKPNPPKS